MKKLPTVLSLIFLMFFAGMATRAQMITGVWSGKINRQKVELKIIQRGDSLTGTSYYGSPGQYRRYRIKGYFDAATNEAVWWDDYLLEEKPSPTKAGQMALLSRADFNCPGGGKMMLDGKSGKKDNEPSGEVHLNKTTVPVFNDEWDFVIQNYTSGGNDPYIIDSIDALTPAIATAPAPSMVFIPAAAPPVVEAPAVTETKIIIPVVPQKIEEKFASRKKILVTEIPVTGDSIELRFYDNAEIDGDSISLFLNNHLLYRNIRLTGNAYTIKLAVDQLDDTSELTMVAENLGSIPPNTSFLVAIVDDKRYEARLESTEGSSAMIRFRKGR